MVMPTPAGKAYLQTMPGITAPFGFFDPMGLTDDITMEEAKLFREAELAHGRVAMMGALGFLVQENFHPIFADIDGPAARQLDLVLKTSNGQLVSSCLLLGIFLSEIGRANFGWQDPDVAMRTLRTEYSPGELSFDPLNMMPKDEAGIAAMKNKEVNAPRFLPMRRASACSCCSAHCVRFASLRSSTTGAWPCSRSLASSRRRL